MRARPVLSVLLTVAALPIGASEYPGNLARNGGFDEALASWTVPSGHCTVDAQVGASRPGSAVCASAAQDGTNMVALHQCAPAGAGVYVFSADAQRLSGANIDCSVVAASHRTTDCSALTDVATAMFTPDGARFVRSAAQSLYLDAATRAVSLDITCVAASSFVVSIDDVTGLPDQIFKHGFEFVSPVITAGAVLNYTENQAASVIDATLTVSDVDSTNLTGATVQISANYQSGADSLAFTPIGAITGNFVVASGTLTLTGTDTLANYQSALRSVTYVNTSDNPSTLVRTITWIANDGVTPPSNSATSAVNVSAVNDAPVLAGTANLTYTENDAATTLSPVLTVTDVDSTTLTGATVRISSNFDAGKDVLTFTPVGGVTGNFVSDTLTLSGSSSLANYQTALRSVKYSNTSDNPSALTRSVTWQVNDGAAANNLSNAPVSTIAVTAVNDAPTGVVPAGSPFAITGNVRRSIAVGTLLAGATDPEGSTLTTQLSGVPTNGAIVVVNTDGSFTYNPGAGYEGTATFQFVVCDAAPLCGTPVTVSVNITGMIWFINASAGAGTGRLTDPMNSIATFNTSNTGTGNNPAANDSIYLYNGTYTGALTLLAGQKLFGEGMSVTLAAASGITPPAGSDALPTTTLANRPTWTSSGTTLTLGSGNTLRGFNIGNSTTAKISGTSFGTLTVNEIALSGTGKALNLTTGAFSGSSAFDSIASTSSGTQGIALNGVTAGTLTIGGTTISGATTQGILIGTTQANVSFGNTSVSAGSDGISLQNNSAGTRTFGTLSITNGSGVGFLHAVGGGATTVTGATTITNPAGTGIDIQSSTTAVTFANTSVSKSNAGTAVNLGGAGSGNSGAITFANLDLITSNGAGLVGTENTGSVTVTNSTGTISATGGPAINITKPATPLSPLALNLGSVSSSGSPTQAVNLVFTSGTLTATAGTLQTAASTTFAIGNATANSGGTVSTTYPGTISQTTSGQAPVLVQNSTGGTRTFSGAVTATAAGVRGISLLTNPGATMDFIGGLNLSTTTNSAFTATGGGTVNVCDESPCAPGVTGALANTLTTTTGTALNVNGSNIGIGGLVFRSIASNGAASGIILQNTGSTAGLTVSGTGSAGTGGTINASTGPGVNLTNVAAINLSFMNIQNGGDDGIRGSVVNGFTLANVNVTSNGNAVGERGIDMLEMTGSGAMSNCTVSGSGEANARIANTTGTLSAFNVTGTTFATTNFTTGDDGLLVEQNGTGTMTLSITGSTFTDNKGDHFQVASQASAAGAINFTFSGNTLTTTPANDPNVIGGGITISPSGSTDVTFTMNGNNLQQAFDDGINLNLGTASTAAALLSGTISNNIIGTAGVADSGSESSNAITITSNGAGTTTIAVTGNTVREFGNGYGILLNQKEGPGTLNATVTGNSVKNPGTFGINGMHVAAGATATDTGFTCAVLTGNDVTGSAKAPPTDTDIRLRQRFSTTIRLPSYGGANSDTAAVNAFVSGNNDPVGPTLAPTVSSVHNVPTGGGFVGGAACPTP